MTHQILAEFAASISELKANPMKVVSSGNGMPIAVLNRTEFFYQFLDRVIRAMFPKDNSSATLVARPTAAPSTPSRRQLEMEALVRQLKNTKNEEDKAVIRNMLEKM
jgi:hypothetical protein